MKFSALTLILAVVPISYPLSGMTNQRQTWIDVAKGIGILLVVYGHTAAGIVNAGIPEDSSTFDSIHRVVYSFHMPLFFAISGILFLPSWQKHGGRGLFWRKTATILYPFVLWTLIQGSLDHAFSRFTNKGETSFDPVTMLVAPVSHLWFLHVLYMLFVVDLVVLCLGERRGLVLTMALALALFPFAPWLSGPIKSIADCLLYFNLGMLLGPWLSSRASNSSWWLAVPAGLTFAALTLLLHGTAIPSQLAQLSAAVLAVSGSATVLALAQVCSGSLATILAYLGRYSLEIYLLHIITAAAVRIGLQRVLGVQSVFIHLTLGMLAGTLLPLAAAVIIHRLGWQILFAIPLSPRKPPIATTPTG